MRRGTPKSLIESVKNALDDQKDENGMHESVKDFIAQKFTVSICKAELNNDKTTADALKDLWFKISGEKI